MRLRTSRDLDALNSVLLEMFGPSGPLKSFSVQFNSTKKTGFCILEMMSPLPEPEVSSAGAMGCGNVVCIEFSMPPMLEDAEIGEESAR